MNPELCTGDFLFNLVFLFLFLFSVVFFTFKSMFKIAIGR